MTDLIDMMADLFGEAGSSIGRQMVMMGLAGEIIEAPGAPYLRYSACQPTSDMMSKIDDSVYQDHVAELLHRDGDLTLPTKVEVAIVLMLNLKEASHRHPLTHEATALYGEVFCELFPSRRDDVWGDGGVDLLAYRGAIGTQIDEERRQAEDKIRGSVRYPERAIDGRIKP